MHTGTVRLGVNVAARETPLVQNTHRLLARILSERFGVTLADVSRETADLLVTDSARGERVLMEMSIIHDWSRNEWIGW